MFSEAEFVVKRRIKHNVRKYEEDKGIPTI
jgi:hypothetical protein